ncbi:NAD(P)-dependent oxidoreductase [Kumtagia ephedrae]|uniref:NAD(P)-dependent oxidoreductase n=1 Tax=Kumtagia ephedrae TaxID=2116701 RepID=A0A2P7SS87_9HYPH|nr:NAD(P)-dependent oxidoreductase [Mesorhizobium ephedrae]
MADDIIIWFRLRRLFERSDNGFTEETVMRIGWIGLGKMGLPIARHIHAAGNALTAYARSDASAEKAAAAGYPVVRDMAALAAASDVVISSISDDAALHEVVTADGALATHLVKGQTYIDTSTLSPEASAAVADLLGAKAVPYLRAPVSGSTATAEAGALTSIVSGPRAEFERLTPLFESFTRTRFWLGEGEQARYMKLAVNSTLAGMAALMAEALAFTAKGGISLADAIEVYSKSAVATPLLDYKRAMILEGRYDPAFAVTQMMKDLDIALSVGRDLHAPLPLAAQVRQQYEAAYLHGRGERDMFVLVKEMADLAGAGK